MAKIIGMNISMNTAIIKIGKKQYLRNNVGLLQLFSKIRRKYLIYILYCVRITFESWHSVLIFTRIQLVSILTKSETLAGLSNVIAKSIVIFIKYLAQILK